MTQYFVGDQMILEEPWHYRNSFAVGQEIIIDSMPYTVLLIIVEEGAQVIRLEAKDRKNAKNEENEENDRQTDNI